MPDGISVYGAPLLAVCVSRVSGAMETELIETGGRPDIVVHFEAQPDAPLEVTPSEP